MYELFYFWILPITFTGSVAVCLSLLFYPALKKLQWFWQQQVLSVAFLFFVLPIGPLLAMLPSMPTKSSVRLQQVGNALKTAASTAAESIQAQPVAGIKESGMQVIINGFENRLLALFPWIWIIGAVAAVLWQTICYIRFCRALKVCSVRIDEQESQRLRGICLKMGRMTPIQIYRSSKIESPILIGGIQPKLYVPQTMGEESLTMALCHELAHLRKGDLWLKLLMQLACNIHWFNPLCRWQAMRFEKVCEFACDEQATAGFTTEERKKYASVLLEAATNWRFPAGVSGMGGSYNNMKKRLEAIFEPKQGNRIQKIIVISAVAIALVITAGGSVYLAVPRMNQAGNKGDTQTDQFLQVSENDVSQLLKNGMQQLETQMPLPEKPELLLTQSPIELVDSALLQEHGLKQGQAVVGSKTLIWPVPEHKGVSRWMSANHNGTDIRADEGVSVFAMESGRVIAAQWHEAYGNYIQIDHGEGVQTLYAHLSKLSVTKGQDVNQGDEIGLVGKTGNATGNQCHVELVRDGNQLDLHDYFDK